MKKILFIVLFFLSNTPILATQNSNDEVLRYVAPSKPSLFSVELGLGYLNTHFTGEQLFLNTTNKVKSATSHGVDIFFNGIFQPSQYLGFSFGALLEFIPIKWREKGLIEPETHQASSGMQYSNSDFAMNSVLTLGILSDIYKGNSNSIRIFANIGVGVSYFLDNGGYEGEDTNQYSTSYESKTLIIPFAFTMPINFGLRFGFAKNHGIEIVGKYETMKAKFKYKYPNYTIKTNISRDMGMALRYVYRFQF